MGPNKPTGLDLIEDLGIAKRSVLVTGHYDNPVVVERCQKLNVGIVPKDQVAAFEIQTFEGKAEVRVEQTLNA